MSGRELVFKVELDGDIRRFPVQEGVDQADTWQSLLEAVRSGFEVKEQSELILKYKDDEGDLCTLVKDTFRDCLQQAGGNIIKLFASSVPGFQPTMQPQVTVISHQSAPVLSMDGTEVLQAMQHDSYTAAGDDDDDYDEPAPVKDSSRRGRGKAGSAAEDGENAGGTAGCRGVGPWRLLACLSSLRASGAMTGNMVASLMLQFLPIMAQRAHRKQEKLNHVGSRYQEMLTPLLKCVLGGLKEVRDTEVAQEALEGFLAGSDKAKLGDCFAVLLKTLVGIEDKVAVAKVLKDAGEELVDIVPRIFSKDFASNSPPMAEHEGTHCAMCGMDPLRGPRFHNKGDDTDLCGVCYIDYQFKPDTKFECSLTASTEASERVKAWKMRMKAGRERERVNWKNNQSSWRDNNWEGGEAGCGGGGNHRWERMQAVVKGKAKGNPQAMISHMMAGKGYWPDGSGDPSQMPSMASAAWAGGSYGGEGGSYGGNWPDAMSYKGRQFGGKSGGTPWLPGKGYWPGNYEEQAVPI